LPPPVEQLPNRSKASLHTGEGGVVMIGPGMEAFGTRAVPDVEWASTRMFLYVDDVEAHCKRARAAGARIMTEPQVHFSGNKIYIASDCGGQQWIFSESS
jgi:uncharacterized glyoxalase superfamily protein PhnB